MGMIDAVKIMRDAELKAESNKITLGEYEAIIRPLRQVMTKADYETRLKSDMAAILTDIQLEIEEREQYYREKFIESGNPINGSAMCGRMFGCGEAKDIIQEKINALRGTDNE